MQQYRAGLRNEVVGCSWQPGRSHKGGKKSFCCVTTRRCKLRILNGLGRGPDSLAARFLSLGVSGLCLSGLAMLSLPSRRLPLADLPQAFRLPAVALIPAPWLVPMAAPLAQADPWPRSPPPGCTATFSRTLASAHGRCRLPGESLGRVLGILPERDQNANETLACQSMPFSGTRRRTKRLRKRASERDASSNAPLAALIR